MKKLSVTFAMLHFLQALFTKKGWTNPDLWNISVKKRMISKHSFCLQQQPLPGRKYWLFKTAITICCGLFVLSPQSGSCQEKQNGQGSDALVSYNYSNPESKTDIPFDKRFTFQVLHFNTQSIKHVYVFEAMFYQGVRMLKNDKPDGTSVFDFAPDHKEMKDTMNLYFPPLKPSKDLDIVVVRGLTGKNLETALKLNEAIVNNDATKQATLFKSLQDGTTDKYFKLNYFQIADLAAYKLLFTNKFVSFYNQLKQSANFPSQPFLTMPHLNLMDAGYVAKKIKFKWGYFMVRMITESKVDDVFAGNLPADYTSATKRTSDENYKGRIANLDKSIGMIDTVYRNLNTFLFKEDNVAFEAMRKFLAKDLDQLKINKAFFEDELDKLNTAIQAEEDLSEVEVLTNSTMAKDIKTQGINIFTLDLGLAGIASWNSRNQAVFLPKLYYGVNIYFRPIDKNTRRETMPKGLIPDLDKGPDYNIEAQETIWQKLSLTVGFTTGSYADQDFANLYNNTSLLIGGGYRFKRAFKIMAGTSLLRRVSNNPVITSKSVCFAPFVSFSVDIDLVQGIKDITSMIWK